MEQVNFMKHLTFANEFWVFILPCALMVVDFITGFTNAWIKRRVKSYLMRYGLGKKVGEISCLIIGELFTLAFCIPSYLIGLISCYIVLMEVISNFENLDKLGVPIPKFIKKALDTVEDQIQNGDININNLTKTEKKDGDNND